MHTCDSLRLLQMAINGACPKCASPTPGPCLIVDSTQEMSQALALVYSHFPPPWATDTDAA